MFAFASSDDLTSVRYGLAMLRHLLFGFQMCGRFTFCSLVFLTAASVFAQVEPVVDYEKEVKPFFAKYCNGCHNADALEAGVRTDHSHLEDVFINDRENWLKVYDMLRFKAMPPEEAEQPRDDERDLVAIWLDENLNSVDCDKVKDPGSVTIRRLNRLEYNNTIRDLFGIKFRPADDFPSDDVGEGFDNIGDVLTLSPLLMEKYLNAAEQVAEQVIYAPNEENQAETLIALDQFKVNRSGSLADGALRFYTNGDATALFEAPFSGKYVLRVRVGADQAGSELAKMVLQVDQRSQQLMSISARTRTPREYEFKMQLASGKHAVRIGFINDFYNPRASDPNQRDRNLSIFAVNLVGPEVVPQDALSSLQREILALQVNQGAEATAAASRILTPIISRAFRRNVDPRHVLAYANLVNLVMEQGETFARGMQVALSSVLVSPRFLFRVEGNRGSKDSVRDIDPYELATRLSYFLWSSTPDDRLLSLAFDGELTKARVLESEIERMLIDPKASGLVDGFATQWLNLRNLDDVTPAPKFNFSDSLRESMKTETRMFFEEVMRRNRSITEFLDGKFTFVNEELAKHYDLPDVSGPEFRLVSLVNTPRYGVLTQGSVLTLTSQPNRTSPVIRGKWIMENILGTRPPDPPEDVPEIDEAKAESGEVSFRKQLEIHRESPICASCHNHMDPLGFGFENYDAIGRFRVKDGQFDIDPAGILPTGEKFEGTKELVAILRGREREFARSLASRMLTFALGRGLRYYDRCAIDKIIVELERDDFRFHSLVKQIVFSDPFLKRRIDGEK